MGVVLSQTCPEEQQQDLHWDTGRVKRGFLPSSPLCLQESLVIDRPRVRKQTKHYNSFEEDELMEFSELDSDSDERPTRSRRLSDKTRRYLRAECFRVEKNLLIFGWVLASPAGSCCCCFPLFCSVPEICPVCLSTLLWGLG